MRIFYGFDKLPRFANPIVTLGSYDGVHNGHREILKRIEQLAKEAKGESVVITFSPHPRQVLEQDSTVRVLNTLEEKIWLLEQAGIDNLIVAPFTKEFSRISPYDFLRDYLVGKVRMATLVVGYDHHFGHNRDGDFAFLTALQSELGFSIYMIPAQEVEQDEVSSTVVRRLIEKGEVYRAQSYLGYPYFIMARLVDKRVEVEDPIKLLPASGTYEVELDRAGVRSRNRVIINESGEVTLERRDGWPGVAERVKVIFEAQDEN